MNTFLNLFRTFLIINILSWIYFLQDTQKKHKTWPKLHQDIIGEVPM